MAPVAGSAETLALRLWDGYAVCVRTARKEIPTPPPVWCPRRFTEKENQNEHEPAQFSSQIGHGSSRHWRRHDGRSAVRGRWGHKFEGAENESYPGQNHLAR